VDIGGLDVEEFQRRWRRARRDWERLRSYRRDREAAGARLTVAEMASWRQARAEFEACERLWDQLYEAGVVVVVGGEE
jgi:phosphoserine phosphatase